MTDPVTLPIYAVIGVLFFGLLLGMVITALEKTRHCNCLSCQFTVAMEDTRREITNVVDEGRSQLAQRLQAERNRHAR